MRKDYFMGDGQKFVNYLLSTPIGRICQGLILLAAIGAGVFHQLFLGGVLLGWFLGVQGIAVAAWVYDRKKNKTAHATIESNH